MRKPCQLGLVIAACLHGQSQLNFPAIGVGPFQRLDLVVIALGGKQDRCRASIGFRDATGQAIGPSRDVDLTFGRAASLVYFPASRSREEIRPFVELAGTPSSCFAAMELDRGTAVAYLAGVKEPPVHPADHSFASFVPARAGERVRLTVTREDTGGASCGVRAQFANERGDAPPATRELSPEPGRTLFFDADAKTLGLADDKSARVIIDLSPLADNSAAGCMIAAELMDGRDNTTRFVPLSVRSSPDPPAAPPTRTRAASVRTLTSPSVPAGSRLQVVSPLGLPPLPVPDDNPVTSETVALGRRLFYDPALSRDRTVSCASCHDPAAGFRDNRRVSQGVNGLDGDRQSMTVFNAAFAKELFWDGRAASLEKQAFGPVENPVEFAFSHRGVEQRLAAEPSYVEQFASAFGSGSITYDKAAKSIAAFQRTVLSGNSPFDRFQFGRDPNALSASAQLGLSNFSGGGCSQCHSVGSTSATFSDDRFHNTGVAAIAFDRLSDQGRWKVTGNESDRGAFRPPSLRNTALFPGLMHNGSVRGISVVLGHYDTGGIRNKWISPLMRILGTATPQIVQSFTDFLAALTGEMPENVGPPE